MNFEEQVTELAELRNKVREVGLSSGWDPSHERASQYNEADLPGELVNQLWGALNRSGRSLAQLLEDNSRLERRNAQLADSNGALMVDRDRGIQAAHDRMRGALLWASDVAKAQGIPEAQWPEDARFRLGQESDAWARIEAERDRLEHLRTGVVCALIKACLDFPEGFSADQVKRLRGTLERENRKAMGHPG
jgi:hypothetical protein